MACEQFRTTKSYHKKLADTIASKSPKLSKFFPNQAPIWLTLLFLVQIETLTAEAVWVDGLQKQEKVCPVLWKFFKILQKVIKSNSSYMNIKK